MRSAKCVMCVCCSALSICCTVVAQQAESMSRQGQVWAVQRTQEALQLPCKMPAHCSALGAGSTSLLDPQILPCTRLEHQLDQTATACPVEWLCMWSYNPTHQEREHACPLPVHCAALLNILLGNEVTQGVQQSSCRGLCRHLQTCCMSGAMLRSTNTCLCSEPGVQRSCCKLLLEDRSDPDRSLHAWEVN